MRVLGIDYGDKRLGVAISDPLGLTAQALPFISNDKTMISTLSQLIDDYEVKTIVVGLPKNQTGEDSQKAKQVRKFGEKLALETLIEVTYWDERFSTKAVEKVLIEADVSRKKRKSVVDSQAAAYILQGYMDRQRS